MKGIWITPIDDPGPGRRVAIKDLFDTAGIRTTYGSKVFARHVPETSAAAVVLLERAGYANAGKANLHEFAYGITSQNPHYGTVPNPRFPGHTAGGSSGGSAAAVAAGEAELGLGTDSGGSIRIPAACCELVGFKPSFGLVSIDGCFPLAPSFDHVGAIAADVAGCARALAGLAAVSPAGVDSLTELRLGACWLDVADSEVLAVVERAVAQVGANRSGLALPSGVFPAFQAEIAQTHRELFARHGDQYGDNVATKVAACLEVDSAQARAANDARAAFRETFDAAFDEFDLLLAPTLPVSPPRVGDPELAVRDRMTQLTFPLNAVSAPVVALPCGRTVGGLPVSLQLIGRPGDDAVVLGAAAALEAELGHTPRPGRSIQKEEHERNREP